MSKLFRFFVTIPASTAQFTDKRDVAASIQHTLSKHYDKVKVRTLVAGEVTIPPPRRGRK
jgi:hypothetical protein